MKTALILILMVNCFITGQEFEQGKNGYATPERVLGFFVTLIFGFVFLSIRIILISSEVIFEYLDDIFQLRFYFALWAGKYDVLTDAMKDVLDAYLIKFAKWDMDGTKPNLIQRHHIYCVKLIQKKHNYKIQTA
jgi:hypothetical protein